MHDLVIRNGTVVDGSGGPARPPGAADVAIDGDRVTAVGRVTIPYLEWGMADPSAFVLRVEKEVHVEVKAAGTLSSVQ